MLVACGALAALVVPSVALGASLRPTSGSMSRQVKAAHDHDYTFLKSRSGVHKFVAAGYLVPVRGNRDYSLKGVSFPYARPEVKTFVERLGKQYRTACREKLVVTSLTRPKSHQPRNASSRSVHPTGMALDLRRSRTRKCRAWLEKTLLSLERSGVLEATRERWPPHYHIALFPQKYRSYLAKLGVRTASKGRATTKIASAEHRVRPGDTLWEIARRYRTTVDTLKRSNNLRSSRIKPGQRLKVPSR